MITLAQTLSSVSRNMSCRRLATACAEIAVLSLIALTLNCYAGDDYAFAEQTVKGLPCADNRTVDEVLGRKHLATYTDLGWRVLAIAEHVYLVERAFLVSQSVQIRYQWLIEPAGRPEPMSEHARDLCAF
ncbi:MAG: hypothetical protein PHW13_00700 [Methylococcales bacterium]|nr:hypothetical protein [Methylococcales bacterium]